MSKQAIIIATEQSNERYLIEGRQGTFSMQQLETLQRVASAQLVVIRDGSKPKSETTKTKK